MREQTTRGVRVNHQIRIPRVRVIDPNGKQLGILETYQALKIARDEYGLDLIEISPTADPPVCKIMNQGKFRYQQKKKNQEAKRNQMIILVKEIKLRPSTDVHDFDFKVKHIARFLEEGNKAKVTIRFKGRELVHSQLGKTMLNRIIEVLGATKISIEQEPKLEGRNMSMILAPRTGAQAPKASEEKSNAKDENKQNNRKTV